MNIFLKKNKIKNCNFRYSLLLENKINKKNDILIFVKSKKSDIYRRLKKRKNFNSKLLQNLKKFNYP